MRWPERPLGELFEIQLGKMLSPKAKTGLHPKPYLRNINVRWRRIDVFDVAEMDFSPEEEGRFRLRFGDLLVCEGGEIGRAALWKNQLPECYYQKALHRLRPRSQDVESEFALYFFEYRFRGREQFIGDTGQTTIAHLPKERLERLQFPLPPLSEQRKIAAILSSVDETIEKTQAVIAHFEAVKNGVLEDLLVRGIPGRHSSFVSTRIGELPSQWDVVAVVEIAAAEPSSFVIGPFGSNLVASDYREQGAPVVFVRDVKPCRFLWRSDVFVSPEKARELSAHQVRAGDVVVTKMGLPAGVAAVYPNEMAEGVVTADIIRIRPNPAKIDAGFLALALNSSGVMREVEKITGGQTRPKLTLRDYRTIPVPVPPLEEQAQIVRIHDSFETRIELERRVLEAQMQLKQSLLQGLLSGEIRVPTNEQEAA